MDLIQILSDWLTYAGDNVKARGLQRVWKLFGFYVIKRYEMRKLHMSSKQTCICWTFDPLSPHKVSKWLWFCENEATIDYQDGSAAKLKNTCRRSLTQRLVSLSSPKFPKYRSKPERGSRKVKKSVAPRWSKPGLGVFKVTTACLCLAYCRYFRKE